MSNSTHYPRRKSFLTLTPVDFSLTAGTNIPAPPDTPPRSPSPIPLARPPTAGGGPLSSHPTSAEDIRSATTLPPTPDPEHEALAKMSTSTSSNHDMDRTDSFRTPGSPASANQKPSKVEQHKSQSVRKLFSLNNLRNSFSTSRTSLQAQSPSAETSPQQPKVDSSKQRPASGHTITPQMRPRSKSGSWFKRKSSMFMFNGNDNLDVVTEDRPATQENSKRIKEEYNNPAPTRPVLQIPTPERESHSSSSEQDDYISSPVRRTPAPAPLLPELGSGNGNMSGGDLGWDEGMFKK